MARLTFDAALHRYRADGVPIPSVTQALQWAGLSDYGNHCHPDDLEWARDRGTKAHRACELWDQGRLALDRLDRRLLPYVLAWRNFRSHYKVEAKDILAMEKMYLGELDGLRFGMTLDRMISWNGRPAILDIKCTRELHPHHDIQTAGYCIGLVPEGRPAQRLALYRRMIVQLKPDGMYQVQEATDPYDGEIFAAALATAHWRIKHGLLPADVDWR